ncbi:Metallo-dependent phosphatase [Tothia fuscella]|uniref:Metallo-dependent phosphatase n=1 Tax=Tothia fuscella TaxID=1048955 RepID=A0A9P4NKN6_9PEZI|nr:Metallo-dependent phosphatase [Tothia fuscella]
MPTSKNPPPLNFSAVQQQPATTRPSNPKHRRTGLWGWVIYRTVYTSESKQHWDGVLKTLDKLLLADFEFSNHGEDPGARNVARENYRSFVLDDEEKYNNAPVEDLETHFRDWTETIPEIDRGSNYSATWKAFLVLDAQAFTNIHTATVREWEMLRDAKTEDLLYGITAVTRQPHSDNYEFVYETGEEHWLGEEEPDFEHVRSPPSWPRYFLVSIFTLYRFWESLTGGDMLMEELYKLNSDFKEGIWTAGWISTTHDIKLKQGCLRIVLDLTIAPPSPSLDPRVWHPIRKDLHLHTSQDEAWLYVALATEEELAIGELVVTDIRVTKPSPHSGLGRSWVSRPGGIWVLQRAFSGNIEEVITEVDVLFGDDAVDPRPNWALLPSPLQLDVQSKSTAARLTMLRGGAKIDSRKPLRVKEDGTFRIVQISDTHMVTGVGVCKDAIDADGNHLPTSEADPLTINFIRDVLDIERPDLVVLTGDQLHHDISDSQSALFKVVAPIIKRSIPFAAVFGNHDSEGQHALSRAAQMSILQNLPFNLSEPGPEHVDGIGNFYLQVLAPTPLQCPLATLYFLDSHGQIPSSLHNPDYDPIKQSQIDWFVAASQAQRHVRKENAHGTRFHLTLAFLHIPLPEFGNHHLILRSGHRREPTEGPSVNTHFYDALANEGILALGCGHDHVNDFCALLPSQTQQDGRETPQSGPCLCYGGGSGFGGYCSYGEDRYHRRMRVWELDTKTGSLKTWLRVEYNSDRVDELLLAESGAVIGEPR